jgi:hypothetical protein
MKGLRSAFVLVLVPLLAPGCASADSPPSVESEPPGRAAIPTECAVTFSPEPELGAATRSAASDWSAATGCAITVGAGGIPVLLADSIPDADGDEHMGVTSPERDVIRIHRRATRRYHVVVHEMGHALGGDHVETDGVLSGQVPRTNTIDAASRASVCSRLSCAPASPQS